MAHTQSTHDENPDVHHETSDINVRAVVMSAVGLAVITAVSGVVVWLLFVYLTRSADHTSAARNYPLAIGQEDRLPPAPRLQTDPKQDLRDLRADEDAALSGYRWIDRNAGVVRIPIDEAMKLTLERGLPSRPTTERGTSK